MSWFGTERETPEPAGKTHIQRRLSDQRAEQSRVESSGRERGKRRLKAWGKGFRDGVKEMEIEKKRRYSYGVSRERK